MAHYKIEPEDEKIRKAWCIWSGLLYIGMPLLTLGIFSYVSLKFVVPEGVFFQLGFVLIGELIWFSTLYYFAYRKYGTVLLTWVLISAPFVLIRDGFEFFSEFDSTETWTLYLFLMHVICTIRWYFVSLNLRRVNKNFHLQSIRSSDDYLQAMQALELASTLDELNVKFSSLIRGDDGENVVKKEPLIEAYNIRKKFFEGRLLPN